MYGLQKMKELLEKLEEQLKEKYLFSESTEIDDKISDTKNKIVELYSMRYNK